jgi:hypothetical protein
MRSARRLALDPGTPYLNASAAAVVRWPRVTTRRQNVGFLTRLFSRPPAAPPELRPPRYPGNETLEVVGESFRQETLWRLVGGRTTELVRREIRAVLEPEPNNPEDENAIIVLIDGQCVGYLSRHDAAAYLRGLKGLSPPVELAGFIAGGGPRKDGIGLLGVFLDHDPRDLKIPRTGSAYGSAGFRTGFSEAVSTDVEDDSYDLSCHAELSDDHSTAIQQLRRMLETELDPIDRHYMLSELVKRLYKCRETDSTVLAAFDAACRKHDAEMVDIRAALFEKFGKVPVIDTYRQAVIRCQKAKDWPTMREWAERGISVYGSDAARPEVVEDLYKRLALALAKIEAAANPKPQRKTRRSTASVTATVVETLICAECGTSFERQRTRGRKPHTCPNCRGVALCLEG